MSFSSWEGQGNPRGSSKLRAGSTPCAVKRTLPALIYSLHARGYGGRAYSTMGLATDYSQKCWRVLFFFYLCVCFVLFVFFPFFPFLGRGWGRSSLNFYQILSVVTSKFG